MEAAVKDMVDFCEKVSDTAVRPEDPAKITSEIFALTM